MSKKQTHQHEGGDMLKKSIILGAAVAASFALNTSFAQDSTASKLNQAQKTDAFSDEKITSLREKLEGLTESYQETKTAVDKLSKIKISGYTQFQFRMATNAKDAMDTANTGRFSSANPKKSNDPDRVYTYPVGNFSGGAFGNGIKNLLQLRRARLKVAYETKLTTAVIQLDCLPFTVANAATAVTSAFDTATKKVTSTTTNSGYLNGGGVTIKDAYLRFTDPWLSTFAIKAGVFDRPFGFEIGYSSGSRETPERSRTEQTLFPGERDLGVSLEIKPSGNLAKALRMFNFKGGVFTGNGINVETDNKKDFIGRFGFSFPFREIGFGIDGGASGYFGKITDQNDAMFTFDQNSKSFSKSTGKLYKTVDRKYFGGDLQMYYNLPVLGGLTLRGEVYKGKQPGFSGNTGSPSNNILNTNPIYVRDFLGYYAWFIQNIDPIKSQLVFKYDVYDPNARVKGDDIDSIVIARSGANALTAADLMFKTLGIGWVFHWDENVKLIAYYEIINNEKVSESLKTNSSFWTYTKDMKANVVTLRVQYKF
jgi:hypothetical protein